MPSLEVIARPHFDKADLAWLSDIRARRAGSRGAPYFTLVFAVTTMEPAAFVRTVRTNAQALHAVRFRLRSALVVPEPAVGRFHTFLIPDEGFGAILKLHDALHAGPLKTEIRRDSPYLPHITVATSPDYDTAHGLAFALNNRGIDIAGHIDALEIEQREGEVIKAIAQVPLAKAGWFG